MDLIKDISFLVRIIYLLKFAYILIFVLYTIVKYCNFYRHTSRSTGGNNVNNNSGVGLQVGIADDQAKDFDFEKTEMKYDSTRMFHWSPARNLEDCILV